MLIDADIVSYDARMRDLVLPSCKLEQIHTGMLWAEGPVYFPQGDYLLWSDIPSNRLYQWVADAGVRIFSFDSDYTNGNTRDELGRLVSCHHITRSVVRTEHNGSKTTIANKYNGKKLNSPNDVIVSSDGDIWFSDPTYGILTNYEGERATPEQDSCNVYRVDAVTGLVEAVVTTLKMPNGLAFSPSEDCLYIADSSRSHDQTGNHHLFRCAISESGDVSPQSIFCEIEHGVPDGLRVDEFGNIWCSSARGVEVYAIDGTHLGVIHIPETVSNLEFGGPKGNRLFITATSSLYTIYLGVSGVRFLKPAGDACMPLKT